MPNDPLDLWPAAVDVKPLTPEFILKAQADRLRERTRGLLRAEVVTRDETLDPLEGDDEFVRIHRFEIIAPSWNGYRHQLFRCHHGRKLVYPVWVTPPDEIADTGGGNWKSAPTQEEFTRIVRELLASNETVAVIQSLLAQSVEPAA